MILKLTVNDNDFTQIIERFANNLFRNLISADIEDDMSTLDKLSAYHRWEEVTKLLNPNITEKLSDTDKIFLQAKYLKY